MSEDEKVLEMPFLAVLPYQILIDKKLPPACKIHFAIICGLSKKYGYCFSTDKQLADLQEVSIKRIEDWNTLLERSGHITRKTINEHIPESKRNNPKQKFRKRRKIYINNAFVSKEFSEPPKIQGSEEPPKIQGSEEPPKIQGYKKKPLKQKKDNKPMKVVIDPSITPPESLDKLDLTELQKMKIATENPDVDIDLAVERTLKWKNRPSDIIGIMSVIKKGAAWEDNATTQDIEKSNEDYLDKLRYLDMTRIGVVDVYIGRTYAEFVSGAKSTRFDISDVSFKKELKEYIEFIKSKV